jgi:hypothetical protein
MRNSISLVSVRKLHFMLEALPDTIVMPVLGSKQAEQTIKPITEATLDDIAFALRGLDAEFSAVSDRLHALRKLYQLARDAGAVGADRVFAAVANVKDKT